MSDWTKQCKSPGSCRQFPPCSNCADVRIAGFRPLPGQASRAYIWPQVKDRSKPAHEMRTGPRASKWAGLEKT